MIKFKEKVVEIATAVVDAIEESVGVKQAKIPAKPKKKRGRPPKGREEAEQKKKSMRSPNDKMMRNYETR